MKKVTALKEVTRKVPVSFEYYCDTCGAKLERYQKVTYTSSGDIGDKHACKYNPCSPFSNPKGYHNAWNTKKQCYEWVKDN